LKKILIFFLILNFSCNKEKFYKEYYPNGSLKLKIKLDQNGNRNGEFEEYYESGKLKAAGNKTKDSAFIFYGNGNIREKGIFQQNHRQNWWKFFDENNRLIKEIEYFNVNKITYKNQYIQYKSTGEIDYSKSSFFKFKIPDTLKVGKNLIDTNEYYTDKNGDKNFHFISIIIDNQYSDKEIKKDTFESRIIKNKKIIPWFGIYAYKNGRMKITGEIEEKYLVYKLISKNYADVKVIILKKYFEKEVYVKK